MTRLLILLLCLFFIVQESVLSAEYQWSTPIKDVISKETGGHPRAFLWIPGDCRQVRAILIAPQNMEEVAIFENSSFRKTLAELGFAEIWITPPISNHFRFDQGAAESLEKTLKTLADASSYQEIEFAPLVPMGHSATASFPFDIDGKFKRFVERGSVRFPLKNAVGDPQIITFPNIPDQKAGPSMPSVKLRATSSAGAHVYYYVREGPATVDDDGNLTFTPIPPRSAYPIKVTVIAWQWGRSTAPLLQTAEPVEKTFSILAP